MDEQRDIEFMGKKNKKGEYDMDSISLKFNNPTINDSLAKCARMRALVQKNGGCQRQVCYRGRIPE